MADVLFRVEPFTSEYEQEWDRFVLCESVNGTFLQSRNFLNYHPKERFCDASFLVYCKGKLAAVCPACRIEEGGKRILYSHRGSTFGGIVIGQDFYTAQKVLQIVQAADSYCQKEYDRVVLKNTANLFCAEKGELLEYMLGYCGYRSYTELSTYIDLEQTEADVTRGFDRNKKRNIAKCEEHGLHFRELEGTEEIRDFHALLTINLSKYRVTPVHTAEELIEFYTERIPDNVKFYGVFDKETGRETGKEKMLAAGMLFAFQKTKTLHAQNLSADYRFTQFSPVTYLYYKVIACAKAQGYQYLSWGISTEQEGTQLNMGLIRNKESYGSRYDLNRTFIKDYAKAKTDVSAD